MKRLVLPAVILVTSGAPGTSTAAQWGDYDLTGFVLDEYTVCDNCAVHPRNPSSYDPRGVLPGGAAGAVNQAGKPSVDKENLFLYMLSAGVSHEFDNAVTLEARATTRRRNGHADIYGQNLDEGFAGASYPLLGSIHYGTLFTRSWSRADAFAYPFGLSNAWAESGAGYGVIRHAVRLATPDFEPHIGKLRLELTWAEPHREAPLNPVTSLNPAPRPRLLELFAQFSNQKNLIELIGQISHGGVQSSFSEGALVGSQGNNDSVAASNGYRSPQESLILLQGTHWFDDHWKVTAGIKRNSWSGLQQQCDYSSTLSTCYYDQAGFNYAIDGAVHSAFGFDTMAGVGYSPNRLWTYTFGGVFLNKTHTATPTEWGQSNTATFVNVGVYRKITGIDRHLDMSVYGGVSRIQFSRQGPAPLSMPNNQAFGGVDPRVSRSGDTFTIGTKVIF
jgi:hypothetical protein